MADRVVMKCTACGFGKCLYNKEDKSECSIPKMEVADTSDTPKIKEPKFVKTKFTFD